MPGIDLSLLVGSSTGETWIIAGSGHNAINGNGGTGYIQEPQTTSAAAYEDAE